MSLLNWPRCDDCSEAILCRDGSACRSENYGVYDYVGRSWTAYAECYMTPFEYVKVVE